MHIAMNGRLNRFLGSSLVQRACAAASCPPLYLSYIMYDSYSNVRCVRVHSQKHPTCVRTIQLLAQQVQNDSDPDSSSKHEMTGHAFIFHFIGPIARVSNGYLSLSIAPAIELSSVYLFAAKLHS